MSNYPTLTTADLNSINKIDHLHQVSLQTIAEYYDQSLMPYAFEYLLRDGSKIHFNFEYGQFAHLMGLHKINSKLSGIVCWEDVISGKITFKNLSSKDKHNFNYIKSRFQFIPSLIYILKSPFLCIYDSSKVAYNGIPKLDCGALFYDELNQKYIHLGIEKYPNKDKYYAKSFFVRNDDVYIKNQEPIAIDKITIIKQSDGALYYSSDV